MMASYSDVVLDNYQRPVLGAVIDLYAKDGYTLIDTSVTDVFGAFTVIGPDSKAVLSVSYGGINERSTIIVGNPPEYTGLTGPANSTYTSLADLKAAPIANGTYSLVTSAGRTDYAYVPGDYTGLVDDVLIVKLDAIAADVGALVIAGTIQAAAFGVSTTSANNGPAFGRMIAVAKYLAIQYAIPPRIEFQSGVYKTSGLDAAGQPVNWAVQGMTLMAQPGVVLAHTGSGRAMVFDGGATGGGVGMIKVIGGLVVRGNANTTDGIYQRAIHHSTFDVEVQNVSAAALRTQWAVCNEYWIRCSPVYRPPFSPVPTVGLFLSSRNAGEKTSRCTFYNPILEGINGYGINLNDAIITTFLGGTSESNVGGLFVSGTSNGNIIDGLDMEFNTTADVFCGGQYNTFRNCLSDNVSTFGGLFNNIEGGLFNALANTGERNDYSHINYGIAGGVFTDGGVNTAYRMMRTAVGGALLTDRVRNPQDARYLTAMAGTGYYEADASQVITGGSAADTYHFKQGAGRDVFGGSSGDRFAHGANGIAFFGAPLQLARLLPPVATDLATTQQLVNAVAQYLIDVGMAYRS